MKPKDYVLMERIGDGPDFDDTDSWLCLWPDHHGFLDAALEQLVAETPFTVKFTILSMTDEEHAAYCDENEIEWE